MGAIADLIHENRVLLRIMGTNVLIAYAMWLPLAMGQFQVTQPVFLAVSGYTGALLTLNAGMPFPLVLVISVAAGVAVAGLVAPLLVRLSGIFLGLVSFALVGLVVVVALNISVTGGSTGLFGIPRKVDVPGIWLAVLVVVVFVILLRRSRFGTAMKVVNDDPTAAAGSGLNVFRMHVWVFVLSAAIASLAGVLRVHTFFNIGPSDFGLDQILGILTFVILGGMRSVWGPLVGTVVVTLISTQIDAFQDWELAVNGLLLLLIVVFLPRGLTSLRLPRALRPRRRPPAGPAPERAVPAEPETSPQGVGT